MDIYSFKYIQIFIPHDHPEGEPRPVLPPGTLPTQARLRSLNQHPQPEHEPVPLRHGQIRGGNQSYQGLQGVQGKLGNATAPVERPLHRGNPQQHQERT